ncbi:MAG: tetratricopeptide repeat protein [Gemmatimonadales bacterium]
MSTSEIAKLESRWRDNPQGLTFAPLAEAYRKQRDPRRALEILQPGLERHPDYIPANIVLGRCHWDLSDLEAAEKAFTHVLALDGENVIALKALADITERQSRPHEAETWLETLLAVDRSNEEARDQLARIRAVQSLSPVIETPSALEPVTDAELAPEPDAAPEPEPFIPADSPAESLAVEEPAPAAFADVAKPADPVEPFRMEPASEASFPPEPTPFPPPPPPEVEAFGFERAEEIVLNVSTGSEFQTPSAADELMPKVEGTPRARLDEAHPEVGRVGAFQSDELPAEPEPEPEAELEAMSLELDPPSPAALFSSYAPDDTAADAAAPSGYTTYEVPAAEPLPAGEPPAAASFESATDGPDTAEPDLVVTETMAQVFLRQGHVVEALAVYRELATRSPDSERLRERVAELEARQLALTTPAPRPSFLARDTGGQSLGSFFSALLGARPESGAPTRNDGQGGVELSPETAPATRPAEGPLSLGSVFGEDPPAVAPAVPPVGAGPAEPASDAASDSVSFDDFFAGTQVPAAAPAPPTRPSRAKPDDDLDQFHTWLQGLKR